MKRARFVCNDCGTTSPPVPLAVIGRLRTTHTCEEVCPACKYRRVQRGTRGLCHTCHRDPEVRLDHETKFWRADDMLDTWDKLRREGYSLTRAAERMGITRAALDKAIYRAGRLGDPRAVRPYSKFTSKRYRRAS